MKSRQILIAIAILATLLLTAAAQPKKEVEAEMRPRRRPSWRVQARRSNMSLTDLVPNRARNAVGPTRRSQRLRNCP